MKINTNEKGNIILEEVYDSVTFKSNDGEKIFLTMRDSGFEITYNNMLYEFKNNKVNVRNQDDDTDKAKINEVLNSYFSNQYEEFLNKILQVRYRYFDMKPLKMVVDTFTVPERLVNKFKKEFQDKIENNHIFEIEELKEFFKNNFDELS